MTLKTRLDLPFRDAARRARTQGARVETAGRGPGVAEAGALATGNDGVATDAVVGAADAEAGAAGAGAMPAPSSASSPWRAKSIASARIRAASCGA